MAIPVQIEVVLKGRSRQQLSTECKARADQRVVCLETAEGKGALVSDRLSEAQSGGGMCWVQDSKRQQPDELLIVRQHNHNGGLKVLQVPRRTSSLL